MNQQALSIVPRSIPCFLCLLCCLALLAAADEITEEPITDYDREHWSFSPLERPPVPVVASQASEQNPIDRFILARLKNEDLHPLPEASRTTLLRRLSFDLLGLPPTPEEIEAFASPESTQSYEQLVDRLLASPRYGERWAQHWLDLARFAETDGFEHDKVRSDAWRYRDWVINALNQDMPYDRFLQLQIAGDELEPDNPDATIATAFCLSGPDMPDINSQEERRHNLLNETTATIGSVVLGLQLGCAQCHDHKYDTISQADFYRMRALFDPAIQVKKNQSIFTLKNEREAKPTFVMLRGDHRRPGSRIDPGFVRLADPWATELDRDAKLNAIGRRTALAKWVTKPDHPLTARVIANRVWQQHFGRGLSSSSSDFGVMGEMPSHPELLDWLATELVHSGWSLKSLHRTIVTSATYRRASRHTEPGWSDAVRRVAAEHIQAATEADPTNEFLARFPRRRLEGEVVRDAMLSISGSLNLQVGGPGVRPPLPPEMLKTLLKDQWNASDDPAQHTRRSIYVFARRNLRFPIFDAFDRPDANSSCDCRNESTTATQSLLMLNSKQSFEVAHRLAHNCRAKTSDDHIGAARVAFLMCFGRQPALEEQVVIERFLSANDNGTTVNSVVEVCLGYLNANEFIYVD